MPLSAASARYSLVKGERIVRSVLTARLRDFEMLQLLYFVAMGMAGSFVFLSVWYSFLTSFLILTQTPLAFSFPLVSPTGHYLTPLSNTTPAQAFRSPLFKKMWSSNVKCKECKKMDRKGNWFIKYCNFAYLHSIKNNILLTYGHLTRTSNLEFNTSFCSVLLMFNTLFRTIFIQISNI